MEVAASPSGIDSRHWWATLRVRRRPVRILAGLVRPLLSLSALLFLLCGSPGAAPASKAAPAELETQVKAAMIYNFTHFILWRNSPEERLSACVLRDSAMAEALETVVQRKGGERSRVASVKRIASAAEFGQCDVVFVPPEGEPEAHIAIEAGVGRPLLAIGDSLGFVRKGGTMGFFLEDDKVRFAINVKAAVAAGLTVSSRLLSLAEVVNGSERKAVTP